MIQFIENIGDYFSQHFFNEDFPKKVFDRAGYVSKQKSKKKEEGANEEIEEENHVAFFNKKVTPLRQKYNRFKNSYLSIRRTKDRVKLTHNFHTEVLKVLGYTNGHQEYEQPLHLSDDEVVPVRLRFNKGNKPYLFIMEMKAIIKTPEEEGQGIYDQVYEKEDWEKVFPETWEDYTLKPDVIKEAISELCLIDEAERPTYIIMLAGPKIFLIHYEKWKYDSYLLFDLETLFEESQVSSNRNFLSVFYALLNKSNFISDTDSLLNNLEEDAHKAAYGVTQSLKNGIVYAVENLANEAIFYKKSKATTDQEKEAIENLMANDDFARELKDDCLTFIYRFLFLFYAEARSDLNILPQKSTVYQKGYSLEMLRDLEMVPLTSDSSRNGYFFSESLWKLFYFLNKGLTEKKDGEESKENTGDFAVQRIDSPLFDNEKLKHLKGVEFRNFILQEIIVRLSLSEKTKRKGRGRISYANLGINQLGSVYESLLAYSGFFAKEDLIEVKNAADKKMEKGTFLVPLSRRDEFKEPEIVKQVEHPERDLEIKKGTFVYRLNGRDRKKSASYYTPEVLTQCTVKYTLKNILEDLRKRQTDGEDCAHEILKLKILEPAMGAAAFHNEVINQLSVAYLELRENEMVAKGGKRITPGKYNDELQKAKAYIAANNVYGVDLNPTAIELGKLSLWLNVIHEKMETPFFGYRLGVGNAVVGAWLKVYDYKLLDFIPTNKKGTRWEPREWWNEKPRSLKFADNKIKTRIERKDSEIYHFLLPDKNMVPSASIKVLRAEYETESDAIKEWRKKFFTPIKKHEYLQLQNLCNKIDDLLVQHYQFQAQVNAHTKNVIQIYGGSVLEFNFRSYEEKERLMKKRELHEAPYFKLKMVMDYWCSLWFWDMRHAADLPSKEEYWKDIATILDIDLDTGEEIVKQTGFETTKAPTLFSEPQQLVFKARTEEVSEITLQAIERYTNRRGLFGNQRLSRVRAYAKQYRFFHYQLEFIEVFRERGGFDVIVGNPPWVKMQFEEKEIIAEKSPEVMIRKTSASYVRSKQAEFLENVNLKELYFGEYIEMESTTTFLNGKQNFPLLVGQQTNLYKCILENGFRLTSPDGYMGLLHPEGVYDDPNGQVLRKEIYPRLKYHFEHKNSLLLFAEVHDQMNYGVNVYSGKKGIPFFYLINNLFHPSAIDESFNFSNNNKKVEGIKIFDKNTGKYIWNTYGHKDRIVRIGEKELSILALAFENSKKWQSAKLVSIHSQQIISVLEKLSNFDSTVGNFKNKTTVAWDETNARNAGIIKRVDPTEYPNVEGYEMIYSGPHFFVGNPLYKTPREICQQNYQYDIIDLTKIEENYIARTNYNPSEDLLTFKSRINGLKVIKKNPDGTEIYDQWADYYKVAFSKMLNVASERTIQPAIIPPKVTHIHGVISLIFLNEKDMLETTLLSSSLVLDFFIKSAGKANLGDSLLQSLPLGIKNEFYVEGLSRLLRLNCLNKFYSPLWEKHYNELFIQQNWSKVDTRLKPFSTLAPEWRWETPLRNYYERRQALVEIDVIVAMALGLTLDELVLIYNVQFPVLLGNEHDTWYDKKGNIVFTRSAGLGGVGLDRSEWKEIRNMKAGETYEHTITKSELYQGEKITYHAPFDKCDRVEDYRVAWAYFEEVFAKEKK